MNVDKTMPCLPPMTGKVFVFSVIKMVIFLGGWCKWHCEKPTLSHILPTYFPHDSPIVWMKSPVPGLPRLDDELLEDELLDALSCQIRFK